MIWADRPLCQAPPDLPDLQRYRSGHNGADSKSVCGQPHVGSNPTRCAKWTRVGVLNSFLRLSNTPTLVLWEKALIFEALPFLMYSLVIHIAKIKVARLVVENRKKPSFEPFVQINLLTLSFAHGAIRTHPVSCG